MKNPERLKTAYDFRRQGSKWKDVALALGVTTERARQMAWAWWRGLDKKDNPPTPNDFAVKTARK